MAHIEFTDVAKRYGGAAGPTTFGGLHLAIHSGEFTVLVGPSGCGKSTLLRMIAGLEDISEGELRFDGVRMNETPPVQRGVAMVFRNYALYAHMTVAQSIGFGLKIAGVPAAERQRQVARVAEQLQLGALLQRKPGQLSGGQRQRVAISRAIIRQPRVYLFDEPLSNLDASLRAQMRAQMRAEIAQLHRSQRATPVYVTHDQVEAMTLADRIVVLSPGKGLEQVGTPDALFDTPANVFVAGFIGSHRMNLVPVAAAQAHLLQQITGQSLAGLRASGVATVGIRPEHVQALGGDVGQVALVERLGVDSLVHLQCAPDAPAFTLLSADRNIALGQRLSVAAAPERLHLFAADGTRLRR